MFFLSKYDTTTDTPAPWQPFSQLTSLAQQLRTSGTPLGRAAQAVLVNMLYSLSRSGPGCKARPGKFSFGVGTGGEGESSGDGGLDVSRLLFRMEAESPSELLLVVGTSRRHGSTIDNYPNSKLSDSEDTGPLLEISLLEEGRRGVCGASVAGRARF